MLVNSIRVSAEYKSCRQTKIFGLTKRLNHLPILSRIYESYMHDEINL